MQRVIHILRQRIPMLIQPTVQPHDQNILRLSRRFGPLRTDPRDSQPIQLMVILPPPHPRSDQHRNRDQPHRRPPGHHHPPRSRSSSTRSATTGRPRSDRPAGPTGASGTVSGSYAAECLPRRSRACVMPTETSATPLPATPRILAHQRHPATAPVPTSTPDPGSPPHPPDWSGLREGCCQAVVSACLRESRG
ncbi:hypothetical protein NSERUTF1_3407 [Nocardia seriolae]|nr:hypothetical protein NSERUTF1_3407 [Nocardia seriolae]